MYNVIMFNIVYAIVLSQAAQAHVHPLYKKVTLACIACLCFEIGVCPWPDLSALFQYTSPTPVVSLHLIPRIQYHPGIPVTLRTGSSYGFRWDRESEQYHIKIVIVFLLWLTSV